MKQMQPILLVLLVGFVAGLLVGLGWWMLSLVFLAVVLIAGAVGAIRHVYLTYRNQRKLRF